MMATIRGASIRLSIALFFIASFISLGGSQAAASDLRGDDKEIRSGETRSPEKAEADSQQATINITYAAFSDALRRPTEPESAKADSVAVPAPQSRRRDVSTAPLSVGEKFSMFWRGAFYPPGPYVSAVAKGMFKEAFDNDEGQKDTFKHFVGDSMTRAARSFASSATSKFLEKFALPSLFRQDPRYHRSYRDGTGARVGHALKSIVVTRGDRGGSQFNVSFILGGAMTSAIANVWEREEKRTVKKSLTRWGNHIAFAALGNLLKEFLSGQ